MIFIVRIFTNNNSPNQQDTSENVADKKYWRQLKCMKNSCCINVEKVKRPYFVPLGDYNK